MAKEKADSDPFTATKLYLIAYNGLQTIGWSVLLYRIILFYLSSSSLSLYETVKWPLIVFQNAAVLEVLHAYTKIVPSNTIVAALQVASRVMVVCGVIIPTQMARDTVGLPLALIAWSITEVIRYGNYTFSLLNCVPFIIKWLRYSTFIILYPIGVTGELLCIYAAQAEFAETKKAIYEMPNSLNFNFNYRHFLWFNIFLYLPLFPQMFMHMVNQRKKVLGTAKKSQ